MILSKTFMPYSLANAGSAMPHVLANVRYFCSHTNNLSAGNHHTADFPVAF